MTKISWLERLVLLITLLCLLASIAFFFVQNQKKDISIVLAEKPLGQALTPEVLPEAPGMLPGERMNINTAPAEELLRLPGIGAVRAADIVSEREKNGPFLSSQDLGRVSGIGEKTLQKLLPYIRVEE